MTTADPPDDRHARTREHALRANGLDLHAVEWPGSGPPLVVLHGLLSTLHSWCRTGEALAERFRVIAVDQRGHGRSSWAPDYTWERWVEDLAAIAAELELGPFHLLGHSMGARTAYLFAALHPTAVEKLVIVDVGPKVPGPVSASPAVVAPPPLTFSSVDAAVSDVASRAPRRDVAEIRHSVGANLKQQPDGSWTWRADPVLRKLPREQRTPDPALEWELLPRIACPTLILRGGESDVLLADTAVRMAAVMAQARVVEIAEAGHSPHTDQPDAVLAALRAFL